MAVEFSEHERTAPLRGRNRQIGTLNNLLPFPARVTKLRDIMAENGADGFESDGDDTSDHSLDFPTDDIAHHIAGVVAGANAVMAAFATLLDVEGVLPKEKVRAALNNAWLDMPEDEALGGAADVFEDVLARLS